MNNRKDLDWTDKLHPQEVKNYEAIKVLIDQSEEHFKSGRNGIAKDILMIAKNAMDEIIDSDA